MSHEISPSLDPMAAYAAAYAMGCDLRQKFGSQNLDVLKRDHIDRPYGDNAHYEQIVRGFTRGYQYEAAPREPKDQVLFRN